MFKHLALCVLSLLPLSQSALAENIPLSSVRAIGQNGGGAYAVLADLTVVLADAFTLAPNGTELVPDGPTTTISANNAPSKFETTYTDTDGRGQKVITDCNGLDVTACAQRHRDAVRALEVVFPRRPG